MIFFSSRNFFVLLRQMQLIRRQEIEIEWYFSKGRNFFFLMQIKLGKPEQKFCSIFSKCCPPLVLYSDMRQRAAESENDDVIAVTQRELQSKGY